MAKTKGSTLPDKKNAPKRTGKSGIGPAVDSAEETAEVKEKGSSLIVEQPPKPKVVGRKFEAFYLKPVYKKNPKGVLLVGLQLTAVLEKQHEDILPAIITNGYRATLKKGVAGQKMRDVPAQDLSFFVAHDQDDPMLILKTAQILNAHVDVVQRKGEGESRKVHRLSFLAQVRHSAPVLHFADKNYGNNFWIQFDKAQLDLGLEEETNEEE